MNIPSRSLTGLQKASISIMAILMVVTFIMANLQALLWQSSDWLVGAVLPAVVVDLTNSERNQVSAAPLVRNSTLDAAAKLKAEDMAKNEYFSHFSPTGVSPWHWFDEAGYVYAYAGENLAIHFTDSTQVVEAWMDSPAHRENIVNGVYTEIGVGTAKGKFEGYNTVYVVQLFGTPAESPAPLATKTKPPVSEPEIIPATVTKTPEIVNPIAEENATLPASEVLSEQTVVNKEKSPVTKDPVVKAEAPVVLKDKTLEPEAAAKTEELAPKTDSSEILVLATPAIATSSGLAVATSITSAQQNHAGGTIASLATQPHMLLQTMYVVLGGLVVVMLTISIALETRRLHYVQVAYGILLLFGMGGLWFIHSLLTAGAVVV